MAMPLDNSELIAPFIPERDEGTFCYTEMLDRGQRKGNNGQRLVKTFYHRSRQEFWDQLPTIRRLCDMSEVRACTRLAPRSFEKVAGTFLRLVTETYITKNFSGMKSLYNKACGTTSPEAKLWLFDVDVMDDRTRLFGEDFLPKLGVLVASIPSRKGVHHITRPFDTRIFEDYKRVINPLGDDVTLHKDNPTNLYIPDAAD